MKILWISSEIPYPPINGYSIRLYNFIKRIGQEHEISLFSLKEADVSDSAIDSLRQVCKEVGFSVLPHVRFWSNPLEFFRYLRRGIPPDLRFNQSTEQRRNLLDFVGTRHFDIVQIEDSSMAIWLDDLPQSLGAKTVLDFQDVGFRKYDRIFRLEKKITRRMRVYLHSRLLKKWEPAFAERFDLCLAMSEVDKGVLAHANPRLNIEVLPSGIDLTEFRRTPIQNPIPTLIFVGNMDYMPNVDAALFFVNEILPLIRRQIAGLEFYIVGINPRPVIRNLAGNGVFVTGRVPDVKPYYERSWVSVVPLRAGTGIRNKILEAMAFGRPTVSTTIGCEGLPVTHGEDILISDDPQQFGEYVVRLLRDDTLRSHLIDHGRKNVERNYNWDDLARKAVSLYRSLLDE